METELVEVDKTVESSQLTETKVGAEFEDDVLPSWMMEEEEAPQKSSGFGKAKRGMFQYTARKMKHLIESEREKMKENACRVVVVGPTGSGKSSLVNAFFGADVVVTGVGKPVTQDFHHIEPCDERPVHLYDSKGFERQDPNLRERTARWVKHMQALPDVSDRLHILWYVVDCGSARWLEADTLFCSEVFGGIPVIVVLHKADLLPNYEIDLIENEIAAKNISNLCGIVRATSVRPRRGPDLCPLDDCNSDDIIVRLYDGGYHCETCGYQGHTRPYGHAELLASTLKVLPQGVKQSFRAAQQTSMHEKYKECARIIVQSGKLGCAAGAIPLPILDEVGLNLVQVRQVVKISFLFGVNAEYVIAVATVIFAAQYIVGQPVGWSKYAIGPGTVLGMMWCMPFYAVVTIVAGLVYGTIAGDMARWVRDYSGDGVSDGALIRSYLKDIDYKYMTKYLVKALLKERRPNKKWMARFMEKSEVKFRTEDNKPSFLHAVQAHRQRQEKMKRIVKEKQMQQEGLEKGD